MKPSRAFPILLVAVITLIPGIFSCGATHFEKDPRTLYVHLSAEPDHLNPVTSTDGYASNINRHIYETLLDRDWDSLELVPQLARSWNISKDRLKYRFYLKKDVVWSDGQPFTAEDVVYSYNVIMDPKTANAPLKVYYRDILDVKKIDEHVVEFTYRRPYYLALEICGSMPIVPEHVFNNGENFNSHSHNRKPVGTGPYKLKEWGTRDRIVLVANERYRDKLPEINKVVYRLVMEPNVALQMLKKGDLDMMSLRAIQWVRQTGSEKFQDNFYKLRYWLPYYNYIGWNGAREPFSNRNVRLAMTHLVNRKNILEKLLFGQGRIVTGTFYIFSDNYNKEIEPWPYDLEKARTLLAEAGWKDSDNDGILDKEGKKFSFTFTLSSGSKFGERLASILKEDLSKVGIEMDITRYEWAVFVQKLHEHDFDAITLAWSLGYSGDPYQLWHSSQIKGGSNYCSFSNRETDRIIEEARREFDEKKRIAMYHRFGEILHEEQPYTFMYCTPALVVLSKRFNNVNVHVKGLNFYEWTVR